MTKARKARKQVLMVQVCNNYLKIAAFPLVAGKCFQVAANSNNKLQG